MYQSRPFTLPQILCCPLLRGQLRVPALDWAEITTAGSLPRQPLLPTVCLSWRLSKSAEPFFGEGFLNSCWPGSPSLFMPCTQSFGPRSGKRDLASSLNSDACQLAPLPEEVIKYGQLRPVSQYLLFPSCVCDFFPTHSLFLPSVCLPYLFAFARHTILHCMGHLLQAVSLNKV